MLAMRAVRAARSERGRVAVAAAGGHGGVPWRCLQTGSGSHGPNRRSHRTAWRSCTLIGNPLRDAGGHRAHRPASGETKRLGAAGSRSVRCLHARSQPVLGSPGQRKLAVALADFLPSSKSTCTLKSCESKSLGRGATVPAPRLWGRTSLFPEESRCPCEPVRPSVSPAPGARGPALAPLARSRGSRCCPELIAEFGVPRGLP